MAELWLECDVGGTSAGDLGGSPRVMSNISMSSAMLWMGREKTGGGRAGGRGRGGDGVALEDA